MSSRPSFQFYPRDWLGDIKLRRCSAAARGVWMDILCVLHDSDEYGVARYPLAELATAVGAPLKLLLELVEKGVLKGCDKGPCDAFVYRPRSGRKEGAPVTLLPTRAGPVWYSSRLVKDEHVRRHTGSATRFGTAAGDTTPGDGGAPHHSPSRRLGEDQGDGSSSSSSSSMNTDRARAHPARARVGPDPGPQDDPPDPALDGHARTPAGDACRSIREAGIPDVNPAHPDLLRLLAARVPAQTLRETALELVRRGKPRFALLLSTVEGRLRDAAQKAAMPDAALPWHETRSGIEAKGRELGLGAWDEYSAQRGQGEQWPTYQARVFARAGVGADGRQLQ